MARSNTFNSESIFKSDMPLKEDCHCAEEADIESDDEIVIDEIEAETIINQFGNDYIKTDPEVIQEYKNGSSAAADELYHRYVRLIEYIARHFIKSHTETYLNYDDYVQEGWMGFFNAVPLWDESKGKLITYTYKAVYRKMYRSWKQSMNLKYKSKIETSIKFNSIDAPMPGGENEDVSFADFIPDDDAEIQFEDVLDRLDDDLMKDELYYLIESVYPDPFDEYRAAVTIKYGLEVKNPRQIYANQVLMAIGMDEVERLSKLAVSRLRNSRQGKAFKEVWYPYVQELRYNEILRISGKISQNPSAKLACMQSADDLLSALQDLKI